ncbi:MAG: beta-propeller domain-containing protein [Bacilli bacterium]
MKKIFLLMLLVLSLFVSGCTVGNDQEADDLGLKTVTGAEDLNNLIKATNDKSVLGGFGELRPTDGAIEDAIPEVGTNDQADYQSDDYTKTNVQVEGVDEGDTMKTDGSRIYVIRWDRLEVIKLLGNGEMEIILNESISPTLDDDYTSYTYYSELYVTDKYLVVTGQKISYQFRALDYAVGDPEIPSDETEDTNSEDDDISVIEPYPVFAYTCVSIVDIYDIKTLQKVDNYQISGNFQSTRLIDNNLYMISNYYPSYHFLQTDEFDIRPWYVHNGEAAYFDYEDIKYLDDSLYQSFTTITHIELDDELTIKNDIFLSSSYWGQIYASPNAIYFAANYYEQNIFGTYEQFGLLVSFIIDEQTKDVSYGGSGKFAGYVINQYAMDEHNGFMRIVTTDGWGDALKNRLYVFERKLVENAYVLEVVGLLDEGLGKPGESVQSVRFNKDFATVVTFLRIDPFYTIDLSDPYTPKITGALSVPGFSTYQHPWGENLILGIGYNTVDGLTTGMKLSLYDVADPTTPVEVGNPLVLSNGENQWSYSEATWNPKAIMIDQTRNSFGFTLHRSGWDVNNYYYSNDYVIFDVVQTRPTPIQIKYSFSHSKYYEDFYYLYDVYYYWYFDFSIQRAFRVDDYVYLISREIATSHNLLDDFAVTDDIIFQEFVEDETITKPE